MIGAWAPWGCQGPESHRPCLCSPWLWGWKRDLVTRSLCGGTILACLRCVAAASRVAAIDGLDRRPAIDDVLNERLLRAHFCRPAIVWLSTRQHIQKTSSFVTYRWILEPMSETILEPMSETIFVRAPSLWLWLLKTGDFCSPFWRLRLVLSKTTPLGEGPWDGGANCGYFFLVLTVIAIWRFRRFNLFILFSFATKGKTFDPGAFEGYYFLFVLLIYNIFY